MAVAGGELMTTFYGLDYPTRIGFLLLAFKTHLEDLCHSSAPNITSKLRVAAFRFI